MCSFPIWCLGQDVSCLFIYFDRLKSKEDDAFVLRDTEKNVHSATCPLHTNKPMKVFQFNYQVLKRSASDSHRVIPASNKI